MLKRFFPRNAAPWIGAPATPRLKTYTAQSGFVFHYFYQGHRPSRGSCGPGTEFAFQISHGRGSWHLLTVLLPEAALLGWQQAHARELSSTERYALAKMKLFQVFDREPAQLPDLVRVDVADVTDLLHKLDVE